MVQEERKKLVTRNVNRATTRVLKRTGTYKGREDRPREKGSWRTVAHQVYRDSVPVELKLGVI